MKATAILLGLETAVAGQLARTLGEDGHCVFVSPMHGAEACARRVDEVMADIVFCDGTASQLGALVAALLGRRRRVPVVVATREPDTTHWLDAIEAGASDYCSAPFERTLVRHILETLVLSTRCAVSPRARACVAPSAGGAFAASEVRTGL